MSTESKGTGSKGTGPKSTEPAREGSEPPQDRPPLAEPLRAPDDPLRGSRTSGAWVALVALGVVLVLLIVFIAQNTQSVQVSFLGWEWQAPLSVAMLIAAVGALFLAVIAGTLRILQLRRRVRRIKKDEKQ